MKNVFLLAFTTSFLFGCTDERNIKDGNVALSKDQFKLTDHVHYSIVVIDGCEYIFGTDDGTYNGGYFLAHKGNCRNKIHQPPAGSP